MIKLEQIARYLENGLNGAYKNPNIQFHIWANAGQADEPFRNGNQITYYITGNLRSVSSSNDANRLVMGANGLSLEFQIPLKRPRSTPEQGQEKLQKIQQGQSPFLNEIVGVLNGYFQKAQSFTLTDEEGTNYSLSMAAGMSLSGVTDIGSPLGETMTATVYFTLYFVEGGIISNNVVVSIDGFPVPFQVVRMGRSCETQRDVYTDSFISKNIASSSAFSIDIQFPFNVDNASSETLSFLLDGLINRAYFVSVQYGSDAQNKLYLMAFDNCLSNAQGVTVSGVNATLAEIAPKAGLLNFSDKYKAFRYIFGAAKIEQILSNAAPNNCVHLELPAKNVYLIGTITGYSAAATTAIYVTEQDFVYDDNSGNYWLYLVIPASVQSYGVTEAEGVLSGLA